MYGSARHPAGGLRLVGVVWVVTIQGCNHPAGRNDPVSGVPPSSPTSAPSAPAGDGNEPPRQGVELGATRLEPSWRSSSCAPLEELGNAALGRWLRVRSSGESDGGPGAGSDSLLAGHCQAGQRLVGRLVIAAGASLAFEVGALPPVEALRVEMGPQAGQPVESRRRWRLERPEGIVRLPATGWLPGHPETPTEIELTVLVERGLGVVALGVRDERIAQSP